MAERNVPTVSKMHLLNYSQSLDRGAKIFSRGERGGERESGG